MDARSISSPILGRPAADNGPDVGARTRGRRTPRVEWGDAQASLWLGALSARWRIVGSRSTSKSAESASLSAQSLTGPAPPPPSPQRGSAPAAQLNQPWWEHIPSVAATSAPLDATGLLFHDAASEYVHAINGRYADLKTRAAYLDPVVNHLLPFFAEDVTGRPRTFDELTPDLVTKYTSAKQAERDVLFSLRDELAEFDDKTLRDSDAVRAQLDAREWEVLWTYGMRGGRWRLSDPRAKGRISLSSRGLSDNEINRSLYRLRDIVRMANRAYKLDVDDPAVDRMVSRTKPSHDWIRPLQFQAVLDAAAALDAGVITDIDEFGYERDGESVFLFAPTSAALATPTLGDTKPCWHSALQARGWPGSVLRAGETCNWGNVCGSFRNQRRAPANATSNSIRCCSTRWSLVASDSTRTRTTTSGRQRTAAEGTATTCATDC